MRDNRIVISYSDGEYLPTDEEVEAWAKNLLVGMVKWNSKSGEEPKWLKDARMEFNKHATKAIESLMSAFNEDCEFIEFLADKYEDDLKEYFREAHERELAENDEPTLGVLENEEYARAVYGGLK